MPVKDACLPSLGVYRLARKVAERYGLTWVDYGRVQKQYRARYSLPVVAENDNGTLWIDRYYIAYQLDDGDVRYIYLTKYHIREEVCSYRAASEARNIKADLPAVIKRQFARALKRMAKDASDIWISPEFGGEK